MLNSEILLHGQILYHIQEGILSVQSALRAHGHVLNWSLWWHLFFKGIICCFHTTHPELFPEPPLYVPQLS